MIIQVETPAGVERIKVGMPDEIKASIEKLARSLVDRFTHPDRSFNFRSSTDKGLLGELAEGMSVKLAFQEATSWISEKGYARKFVPNKGWNIWGSPDGVVDSFILDGDERVGVIVDINGIKYPLSAEVRLEPSMPIPESKSFKLVKENVIAGRSFTDAEVTKLKGLFSEINDNEGLLLDGCINSLFAGFQLLFNKQEVNAGIGVLTDQIEKYNPNLYPADFRERYKGGRQRKGSLENKGVPLNSNIRPGRVFVVEDLTGTNVKVYKVYSSSKPIDGYTEVTELIPEKFTSYQGNGKRETSVSMRPKRNRILIKNDTLRGVVYIEDDLVEAFKRTEKRRKGVAHGASKYLIHLLILEASKRG